MEPLVSIDNFCMMATNYLFVIIGEGGIGDTFHARDLDRGVENNVDNFSSIRKSGGVCSKDELMIISFSLSFLKIIGCV